MNVYVIMNYMLCTMLGWGELVIQKEYREAFNYIDQDASIATRLFNESDKDSKFIVSSDLIPFNLNTVLDDIVVHDYISDYSIFRNLNKEEALVYKRVMDSVASVDEKLNAGYTKKTNNALCKLSSGKRNADYIIFFTDVSDNLLYAQVLQYNESANRKDNTYGTALTYLFIFDQQSNISKVYNGTVSLN